VTDITGGPGIGVNPSQPPAQSGVALTKCGDGTYQVSCPAPSSSSSPAALAAAIIVIVLLVVIFAGLVFYRHRTHSDETWKESCCTTLACCGLCSVPDSYKDDNTYKMEVGSPRNHNVQMSTPQASPKASPKASPALPSRSNSVKNMEQEGSKSNKSLISKSAPKATSSLADLDEPVTSSSSTEDFAPSSVVVLTPTSLTRQNTGKKVVNDGSETATNASLHAASMANDKNPVATQIKPAIANNDKHAVAIQIKPATSPNSPTASAATNASATPTAGGGGGFFSGLLAKKKVEKDKPEAKASPASSGVSRDDMTFEQCLASAKGLGLFSAFLDKERSSENLLFWKEVEKYRARKRKLCETMDPGSTLLRKDLKPMAISIYTKFMSKTVSSLNVNVPEDVDARLVTRLRQHFDQGVDQEGGDANCTVFDEAQEVILRLMESDSWKRFVKTNEYSGLLNS